jgi:hypothetical protein
VVGQVDDAGDVAWFSIQPFEKYEGGATTLTVERFDGRDAIVLIGGTWLAVPVPSDAALGCRESGDLTVTPIEVPSQTALVRLNADLEVVGVECLYAE